MNALFANRDVEKADDGSTSFSSTGTKNQDDRGRAPIITSHSDAPGSFGGAGDTVARGAADWVSLAAAPTFAIMALLVSASPESSRLSGMVLMYILMATFESVAWLKLISNRERSSRRE